jgi:hypothetical protein
VRFFYLANQVENSWSSHAPCAADVDAGAEAVDIGRPQGQAIKTI